MAAEKKPRRVAFVHDSPGYGGIEVLVARVVRYLDRSRYEPIVIVPSYYNQPTLQPFIEQVEAAGVPLIITPPSTNLKGLNFIQDVFNLRRLFKAHQIDIVQIHTRASFQGRKATLAARLAGVPAVIRTEHSSPHIAIYWHTKYVCKPFDGLTNYIVTVCDSDRDEQIDLLDRNPAKVYSLYNGIELQKFNPSHDVRAAKQALGLDPDIPVVGLNGRLAEQKGHAYLIEAAPAILKEYGAVNFLFVGNGELEDALKAQVSRLNLQAHFHFKGFQANPIPYLEAMDVFAFPSLYEAFPIAMLEYMALAKPIIITDIPCAKELVIDGESALVVPVKNSQALADGILKLLREPQLSHQLGQMALRAVRAKFSIELNVEHTMNLYDKVLGIKTTSQKTETDASFVHN